MNDDRVGQGRASGAERDAWAQLEWIGKVAVLHVYGPIDMNTVHVIDMEMLAVISDSPVSVVIDLTGTTFFGSSGLQSLVTARTWAARSGIELRVVVASERIRRPIELTGLDEVLNLEQTVTQALMRVPHRMA